VSARERLIKELERKLGFTRKEAEAFLNQSDEKAVKIIKSINPERLILIGAFSLTMLTFLLTLMTRKRRRREEWII